jgi:hypothetical protein
MNKIILCTLAILALGAGLVEAADPTHLEGAATTSVTITNTLGRAYVIEHLYTRVRGAAAVTNTLVVSVLNQQDQDLTGTNATLAYVEHKVKSSGSFLDAYAWTPSTPEVVVPIGAALKLTFTGGCTNDYLVFRDDADD